MYHSKISIHSGTQDVGHGDLKERLLKEGDSGISTVQDKGIVVNVFDGYVIGQRLSILFVDVELLYKFVEDSALGS